MRRFLGAMILALTVLLACASAEGPAVSISRGTAADLTAGADVRELSIPEGVVRIEAEAFAGTGLELVTLPFSLESVADDAFDPEVAFLVHKGSSAEQWAIASGRSYSVIEDGQEDLLEVLQFEADPDDEQHRLIITGYTGEASSLILPDQIDGVDIYRIGEGAFQDKGTLRSIRFPARLEAIDNRAFANSQIESVVLPDSVTFLSGYAFADCQTLATVVLPGGLEGVTEPPFVNCPALREVTMSVHFQSNMNGFRDCENVETIHYLPGTTGIFDLTVGKNNSYLERQSKRSLKTLDFAGGITVIEANSFLNDDYEYEDDCFAVERIQLPSTLKTIGDAAFSGLNRLTQVDLPEGLTILGSEAFSHCRSLMPPETLPSTLTVIGENVFYDCWQPEPEEGSGEE